MLSRPGASWNEGWKLRSPCRMSWRWAPAAWAAVAWLLLDDERLATAPHPALHQLVVVAHREEDHRPAAVGPHLGDELVIGVEDRGAAPWDGLDDDPLDRGQLPQGVALFQAEVVAGDVQHNRDVVRTVAEPLAQDPAASDLEDGEVDAGILQHHACGTRPAGVGLLDQPAVDIDAVGGRHPDLVSQASNDVGDHPGRRRLPVRAGDGHDGDTGRR